MHGDENARDVARRLVQEVVSRADASPPEPRPVLEPEPAPVLEPEPAPVLEPEPAPVLEPEPAPEPAPPPEPAADPEAVPDPPPGPVAVAPPVAPATAPARVVSRASAEAARRIVAAAVAEQEVDHPEPPTPSVEAARRLVAQSLDEPAARSVGAPPVQPPDVPETGGVSEPAPSERITAEAPPIETPPVTDERTSWPTARVDLLPVGPHSPAPAQTHPDDRASDPVTPETNEPTVQIPVVALPPVFPSIGEPGMDASLLDQMPAPSVDREDDATVRQVPGAERLTLLDRWRARRHRKRLAAQWAPGATPQPRRTWRWVLATIIVALAIGVLFPLTVAAFRALVAL